ncbi:MAG: hypothetical protein M0034_01970, partial [Deltaproteobacteria bacterium]|nr:hypothetical protein [Deltaproteobacteria bacterium]
MTKRRKARELALQFLYEEDGNINNLDYKINCFYNDFASESLMRDGFIKTKEDLNRKKDIFQIFDFFANIVRGTLSNLEKIDGLIRTLAKNWT